MDTKLHNKDIALDNTGLPYLIEGIEELLQRAFIRLKVKKGSFSLDSTLGSTLHTLVNAQHKNLCALTLNAAREALQPIDGVVVEDVEINQNNEVLNITVLLLIDGKRERIDLSYDKEL